jgi:RNA recognition motif-containing protein
VDLVSAQQSYINRRITVSKIDFSISEANLRSHFSTFGEIESILFLSERDGAASTQTAQIIFANQSGAEKAKTAKTHLISGLRVFVKITESKNEKRQKQILNQVRSFDPYQMK